MKYLTKKYSRNNPCDSLGGLLQTRRLTNLIHPDPEVKVSARPRMRPAPFPELGFKAPEGQRTEDTKRTPKSQIGQLDPGFRVD